MELNDFFEMFDDFENGVAVDDSDFKLKYQLTDEEFRAMSLVLHQRHFLLMDLYIYYFNGGLPLDLEGEIKII